MMFLKLKYLNCLTRQYSVFDNTYPCIWTYR